ncbi:hypothetical protein Q73_06025 [Bacillus coahuilensis m2-6]|uniref:hypothetical protein n=1 Tax=Bacillus coahuilensis TaxID=408580 RepID=UPI0007502F61|nr:hypothetical protein [Bacillus coahuilensis]KUP08467.1 hypothetical protein Q73_06025 [Bacillus coahuilensis m2-6]
MKNVLVRYLVITAMIIGCVSTFILVINSQQELEYGLHVLVGLASCIVAIFLTSKVKSIVSYIFLVLPVYLLGLITFISAIKGEDGHYTAGMFIMPIIILSLLISLAWNQKPPGH